MSVPETAKFLRVSERTLHNWESGRARVPYAAYKLLRVMRGHQLLHPAWKGFSVRGDTLWTPEGRSFKPSHMTWWSLTCRMADQFRLLMGRAWGLESQLLREVGSESQLLAPNIGNPAKAAHPGRERAPAGRETEPGILGGSEAQGLGSKADSSESPILTLPKRPDSTPATPSRFAPSPANADQPSRLSAGGVS